MALGRRGGTRQEELWVPTAAVARGPGHPFYDRLNELLAEAGFDGWVEARCRAFYAGQGRPGIPPGVYFRMLLIGYFEGLESQRGIAWRCADSNSLKSFLGFGLTQATPDHSSLTHIRKRLPLEVHEQVFAFVLGIAQLKQLLKGQAIGVDATLLEANAALKAIVRRDTGEDYRQYLRRLAQEAGIEDPSDDDLKRFDRKRKGKKLSNDDWQSATDADGQIAKMKDGTTHIAYKAEHAVDLESELLLAATVQPGDAGDPQSLPQTLVAAQVNLMRAGSDAEVRELATDSGYHSNAALEQCVDFGIRTYISEKDESQSRVWTDKPAEQERAFRNNRRRLHGRRGRRLRQLRRLLCERSFAHTCETGAGRRSWLRGLVNVSKRYVIHAAAYNLGVILRKLFGIGTPRSLQGRAAAACAALFALLSAVRQRMTSDPTFSRSGRQPNNPPTPITTDSVRLIAA
jgi:transposase